VPAPDPDLAAELDLAVELEDYLELGLRSVVGERWQSLQVASINTACVFSYSRPDGMNSVCVDLTHNAVNTIETV
jgi:hypothetical protein